MSIVLYCIAGLMAFRTLSGMRRMVLRRTGSAAPRPQPERTPEVIATAYVVAVGLEAAIAVVLVLAARRLA